MCSPPWLCCCFFIAQQTHLGEQAEATALSASPPCQSLLPKAEVLWYGKADLSPPASSSGTKGPGCWFPRSPDNSSEGSRHPLCPLTRFCCTPQLPQWLFLLLWGARYFQIQCRRCHHHHQYNVLEAGEEKPVFLSFDVCAQ